METQTKWVCPICDNAIFVDAYELAEIGTPHCSICDDQEMEPTG